MSTLSDGWGKLTAGTLWRQYAKANPSEAKVLNTYVQAVEAGLQPATPMLATLTGEGLALLASLGEQPVTPPPPPPPPPAGSSPRLCLFKEGSALPSTWKNLGKYSLAIVSGDSVGPVKSLMPQARKLLYSNASCVHSSYSEGLTYSVALANNWIVGSNGDRYVVDHSNSQCNTAMAQAAFNYVKANGMDGCFLDDTVPLNPYGVVTPAGWEAGMVSFVHQLRDLLAAAGLVLYTNSNAFNDPSLGDPNSGAGDLAWAKQLSPHGIVEECWQQTRDGKYVARPRGANWNQHWDDWQTMAAGVWAAGMDFVGLTYANRAYGAASLLLTDQGRSFFAPCNLDGSDPWDSTLDAYSTLGSALGAPGGTSRSYTGGSVSVDPVAVVGTVT